MRKTETPEVPASRGLRRAVRLALISLIFTVPLAGGWFNLLQVLRDGDNGVQGLDGASGVAISPDGRYVFTSASLDDSFAVFRRDASRDSLEFYHLFQDGVSGVFGLDGASATAASPDQRHIYAVARGDDTLTVFRRDASLETFAFVDAVSDGIGGVFGLEGASSVAVTPDDRHVVVTAAVSNAITLFRRDASLDSLAFVDIEADWVGLGGASSAGVDPEGQTVLVTGEEDDGLAVFSLDGDALEFSESYSDGVDGVDGLDGASDVAWSPDGRYAYVTGSVDDSISVFEKLPAIALGGSGVAYVRTYRDGVDGFDGLDGAAAVAVSPSGELVFVASRDASALAVFRAQPGGRLVPLDVIRDGEDGIDGLGGAVDLVVSSDTLHVYVAASDEDALTSLRILTLLFEDDFESGNTAAWSLVSP